MKSRGFWRAPRHLVLLVEDGAINIGDLGLLTLIALDGGERDGFHVATWGALAATAGESEKNVSRRLQRLRGLELVDYDEPGRGGRNGFRVFLGPRAAVSQEEADLRSAHRSLSPLVESDRGEVRTHRDGSTETRIEEDETPTAPSPTDTEKKEKNRDAVASMKERQSLGGTDAQLTHTGDALTELVRNLLDADEWTERTFRKLFGHMPQEVFGQVLHELRKRRTRTDLGPIRTESGWAHDRLVPPRPAAT
jgi:hypothetical protein